MLSPAKLPFYPRISSAFFPINASTLFFPLRLFHYSFFWGEVYSRPVAPVHFSNSSTSPAFQHLHAHSCSIVSLSFNDIVPTAYSRLSVWPNNWSKLHGYFRQIFSISLFSPLLFTRLVARFWSAACGSINVIFFFFFFERRVIFATTIIFVATKFLV